MTDNHNWAVGRTLDGDDTIIGYFTSFERACAAMYKLYDIIPNTAFYVVDMNEPVEDSEKYTSPWMDVAHLYTKQEHFEHDGIHITDRFLSPCGRFNLSLAESIDMYGVPKQ
jgi:hypothetical protein